MLNANNLHVESSYVILMRHVKLKITTQGKGVSQSQAMVKFIVDFRLESFNQNTTREFNLKRIFLPSTLLILHEKTT